MKTTEREQLETLQRERDLFFNHSMDLLALVGSDGYFKRVNAAFERTLGYSEREFYSKPVVDFLHPDDVEKTRRGIATLASGTPTVTSLNRYLRKDGAYRWFSWNTVPAGPVFYTVGRDVTDQIAAEERIRHLNLELQRQLRSSEAQVQQLQKMDAVGRLAGGVAHDFNNMLGAITMYCDLLEDDAGAAELVLTHVKDIRRVADRGAALTRQLLVFSRKQITRPETVVLNPVIEQLKKMLARLIGESIEIVTRLTGDLKPVSVDTSQLEQVLMNLVVNARDAISGEGRVSIETRNVHLDEDFARAHLAIEPGEYVLLSVSDTGCGMDAETQARIFEPFFTTKPIGKGTGLGLTTTYGIVKQSKGSIWVYSEPGKGSVFKIYLPVAEPAPSSPTEEDRPAEVIAGTQTVLLVEDDENLRTGFGAMLLRAGYQVLCAADGAGALSLVESRERPIHLLVTDVVLPGMNGIELASKIASSCPGIRVLYMSGYTSDALETTGASFTQGGAFLQKPFNTSALLAKVHEVLSGPA